jgi:hypothetical protein
MTKTHQTQTLTAERLRAVLEYEPESGVFVWKPRADIPQWTAHYAGRRAGCIDPDGYRRIKIDGVRHKASRLVFLYMEGEHPADQVDHKKGRHADDRWLKLRPATPGQNQMNKPARINNKLGVKGVYWSGGKYKAAISSGGKRRYLGRFSRLVDAVAAYNAASEELHGEYSRQTEMIQVAVTQYGDGALPADQIQIGPDGTVVEVTSVQYEAPV